MASIVFDPADIDSASAAASDAAVAGSSHSSNIAVNDGDIDSRSSEIVVVDGIADAASTAASGASVAASGASVAASGAAVAGSSHSSNISAIEGDNRYAKSIYSDPSSGSYAIFKVDITSDSHIFISHSDTAAA